MRHHIGKARGQQQAATGKFSQRQTPAVPCGLGLTANQHEKKEKNKRRQITHPSLFRKMGHAHTGNAPCAG